jgi:Predicted transcriptional regulators
MRPRGHVTRARTLTEALGEKVRELLIERRWTQRDLATHLGSSQGALSFLLMGQRRQKSLPYYERVAAVFEVPLSTLIRDLERRVEEQARLDALFDRTPLKSSRQRQVRAAHRIIGHQPSP